MNAIADESLRDRVHREYRHQSYMLVEDERGARLYLFDAGPQPILQLEVPAEPFVEVALEKTRSVEPRVRVRGLLELAGADDPAALDTALILLNDPSAAVRDEARNLILDHPAGAEIAASMGLVDPDLDEDDQNSQSTPIAGNSGIQ